MLIKMKNFLLTFMLLTAAINSHAEQGCPPGQYPIGGQGVAACAPIPKENPIVEQPRPSGKWLKTWGAIASDGGDNLGVSTGKLKKADAQDDALSKCKAQSGNECRMEFVYENQCAAIAEPYRGESAISGIMGYAGAPTKDIASTNALSFCKKNNANASCRIIYTACSEPIFERY
ncbi:DUF4189 domain-containing protein [Xanthomonas translucens pv. undulosa]|uniref:DUF4189 domain-containing protein n=1 Tax=Xanthomonas campestris pv. translucens TaxID=343 RepID=UPI003CF3CA4C